MQHPLYPVATVQAGEMSAPININPPYPMPTGSPYYPTPSDPNTASPPYPMTNVAAQMPQPTNIQQWNPTSYDDTGPRYPLIPPGKFRLLISHLIILESLEAPPPSYSDVIKQ